MKIAVVGAGLCGVASVWELLKHDSIQVTLFDGQGIAGGTSGMAAGLLHPFAGAHSKLNWKGREGLAATWELLEVASKALGRDVVCQKGILRLALTEDQISDFSVCASKYPDVEWWEAERCQKLIPGLNPSPGLWIKDGLVVSIPLYLEGLWKACQNKGAQFEQRDISHLADLAEYDLTIATAGASTQRFPEFNHLPLKVVKGQVLEYEWPKEVPPLPCAINSQVYLVMSENRGSCIVGGTFEKEWQSDLPDVETAKKLLLPKLKQMYPTLNLSHLIGCHAGFRSVSPNHLPLLVKVTPKLWTLAGMGSKGLIYHALFAKEIGVWIALCDLKNDKKRIE